MTETSGALDAPTIDPSKRDPAEVQPADSYEFGQRVWVYPPLSTSWRPGLVEGAAPAAVMVRYLPTHGRGQLVDTVTPVHVLPREQHVPDLDPPLENPPHEPGG